jgi:signal transduction histidine kinase
VLTASAGYYCSRRQAVAGAAVTAVVFAVVTLTTAELRSPDAFVTNMVFLLAPWVAARTLREREERAAALAATLATERTSKDADVRQAAAAERSHIARELHDIVAHSVSMMVIQIGAARVQLHAGAADVEAPLLDAEAAGRQTLDDLRRLLGVLRADERVELEAGAVPEPPQPGLETLEGLVAPAREAGLDVEVDVRGVPVALPAALDLTAYRIVQEALTNALKHSGATTVRIGLTYMPSELLLCVDDDGRGEGTAGGAAGRGHSRGHGLVGMRERVSLFGGAVSAGPAPVAGWQVRAELPLPVTPLQEQQATALPAT